MRLEQLRYLVAIEKYGSLSKAAEQLYLTHSALSIAVNNLEKELGAKIFERTRKGLVQTDYGTLVLGSAKKVLQEISLIKQAAHETLRTLHVASIATISNNILLDVAIDFKKEYPLYNVVVDEIYPNDVLRKIINSDARIGVSFFEKDKEKNFLRIVQKYELYWEPLYRDYLCIYVSKDNPLVHKELIYEKDVKTYLPVSINHRQNAETKSYYTNFIDNEFFFSFTNQESIKKMIAEYNGVAYLPKILSYNDYYVKTGAIVPLDVIDNRQEIVYYVIHENNLTEEEQSFVKKVKSLYHKLKNM